MENSRLKSLSFTQIASMDADTNSKETDLVSSNGQSFVPDASSIFEDFGQMPVDYIQPNITSYVQDNVTLDIPFKIHELLSDIGI